MPNYCSNSLTVTGEDAARFVTDVVGDGPGEDGLLNNFLSVLLPMPEPLATIHVGGTTIDGKHVRLWRRVDDRDVAVTPGEQRTLVEQFGAADPFEWTAQNWGTKWGTLSVRRVGPSRFTFDSAWTPPREGIRALSRRYPRATFRLAFAEGGMGFYGLYDFRDGEIVDREARSGYFYDEDEDGKYALVPEVAAFLAEHHLHPGG